MDAMDFDVTITLGDVLQIGSWIGIAVTAYFALKSRLDVLEATLKTHAHTLSQHAERLDRYEQTIVKVVGDLQRMIGKMEALDR